MLYYQVYIKRLQPIDLLQEKNKLHSHQIKP
jgi:hypothetical protein